MRIAGIIFSAIFALLAVPLFTMAACNLAIEASFLNRSTYDDVLQDTVIFEDVLPVALPAIFSAADAEELEFENRDENPIQVQEVVRALEDKPEVWGEVVNLLVPPEWLQQTVTQFVDVLFAIFDGNFDAINATVDLAEVRQRFNGEEASQAANLIISEAPNCTNKQIEELNTFFSQRSGVMPICNPPDERTRERSIQLVENWFTAAASHLSEDKLSFSEFYDFSRDNARSISLFVELDRQGLILTYLCPMAFLSLIVILAVRSRQSFGRWIGITTIISGIGMLLTIFMLQVALFRMVTEALSAQSEAEQFFARLVSEILRSALAHSSTTMLIQAAIFIGIGFVLLVILGFSGGQAGNMGSSVLITEDGQIISTATQKRIGTIAQQNEES